MSDERDIDSHRKARLQVGVVIGYIALIMGVLTVVSQASEAEALPMNVSAAIVLLHMVGGFVLGWLLQPVFARWLR